MVFSEFWSKSSIMAENQAVWQKFKQQKGAKALAYLRVSTKEQNLEKNKAEILFLANDKNLGKVFFIAEKVSGRKNWRERWLGQIIEELEQGDTIIVNELSRIGRSMLEIMEVLQLALKKGIRIYAVKGGWQLDESLQSKIMALVFSMAAEIERDLIAQRTKEALAARKAKGLPLGRPKGPGRSKLDPFWPEIQALLAQGSSQRYIADRYKTTPSNLNRWLKQKGWRKKDEPKK
ncbi:resolvase domain protein (plasmid) [Saprospira grandis str. Lewin]|uniref:Resolvase domain protein n=2 Tax=Saprospira TaxID=1007 RepID=H6LB27_SAPGL|nr:resolvase domain protein [Saprospira grandis str. Lewin]